MFSLDHRTFLEQDFAIVDPVLVDPSLWKHLPARPLGEQQFDCTATQLPQLLCLREADKSTRIALLDVCDLFTAQEDTAFFCALLRTGESTTALAQRLSQRLLLTRRASRQTYYFRYFDPRVFVHLQHILSPDQLHRLLAPARAWTWFDPLAHRWREHRPVADGTSALAGLSAPLALADAQLDSVARIELVNRVVRRWQAEHPGLLLAPSQVPAIDAHAMRAIEVARLQDDDGLVQFVLDALAHDDPAKAPQPPRAADRHH